MQPCAEQILRGYDESRPDYKLSYNKATALIARDENNIIVGWAMVRHPSRRVVVPLGGWRGIKAVYAGRRSDIVMFVSPEFRRQGVARQLLVVGYNNFGRMVCFPHDRKSSEFYRRNKRFVTARDTNYFNSAEYLAFEVA